MYAPPWLKKSKTRRATIRSSDPAEMAQFIRWLIMEGHTEPAADELKKYAENFPEANRATKQLQALLAARPQVDEQPPSVP